MARLSPVRVNAATRRMLDEARAASGEPITLILETAMDIADRMELLERRLADLRTDRKTEDAAAAKAEAKANPPPDPNAPKPVPSVLDNLESIIDGTATYQRSDTE